MRRVPTVLLVTALTMLAAPLLSVPADATSPASIAGAGLTQSGRWVTDRSGRVVVLHGLNQVFKVAPYEPSANGFGDDDAAFLAANGFDAVRVGVIWAAVEPQPGHYDNAYLTSVADTIHTLATHGIVSLLDFHQDMYNEKFQGEGAPAWAVQDGGLPNPTLGFPGNYLGNPAEWRTWDNFWTNASATDGIGLQDHYARAWAHVAARFAGNKAVAGYEVLNEPWPGTFWEQCAVPLVGCPLFEAGALSRFYQRVDTAIRTVDTNHSVYFEPQVLFTQVDATSIRLPADQHAAFAFHDYCSTEEFLGDGELCRPQDNLTIAAANRYAQRRGVPPLLTEFGATNDLPNVDEVVALADQYRLGWLEWAYTGNDKTSSSPDGQALVLDPSKPPTGSNVLTDKLKALAEPYPQAVAGIPTSWSFTDGIFRLTYATTRADGTGSFGARSETDIAVPAVQYPTGYRVAATGATVASAPNSPRLRLLSRPGADTVHVTITAA